MAKILVKNLTTGKILEFTSSHEMKLFLKGQKDGGAGKFGIVDQVSGSVNLTKIGDFDIPNTTAKQPIKKRKNKKPSEVNLKAKRIKMIKELDTETISAIKDGGIDNVLLSKGTQKKLVNNSESLTKKEIDKVLIVDKKIKDTDTISRVEKKTEDTKIEQKSDQSEIKKTTDTMKAHTDPTTSDKPIEITLNPKKRKGPAELVINHPTNKKKPSIKPILHTPKPSKKRDNINTNISRQSRNAIILTRDNRSLMNKEIKNNKLDAAAATAAYHTTKRNAPLTSGSDAHNPININGRLNTNNANNIVDNLQGRSQASWLKRMRDVKKEVSQVVVDVETPYFQSNINSLKDKNNIRNAASEISMTVNMHESHNQRYSLDSADHVPMKNVTNLSFLKDTNTTVETMTGNQYKVQSQFADHLTRVMGVANTAGIEPIKLRQLVAQFDQRDTGVTIDNVVSLNEMERVIRSIDKEIDIRSNSQGTGPLLQGQELSDYNTAKQIILSTSSSNKRNHGKRADMGFVISSMSASYDDTINRTLTKLHTLTNEGKVEIISQSPDLIDKPIFDAQINKSFDMTDSRTMYQQTIDQALKDHLGYSHAGDIHHNTATQIASDTELILNKMTGTEFTQEEIRRSVNNVSSQLNKDTFDPLRQGTSVDAMSKIMSSFTGDAKDQTHAAPQDVLDEDLLRKLILDKDSYFSGSRADTKKVAQNNLLYHAYTSLKKTRKDLDWGAFLNDANIIMNQVGEDVQSTVFMKSSTTKRDIATKQGYIDHMSRHDQRITNLIDTKMYDVEVNAKHLADTGVFDPKKLHLGIDGIDTNSHSRRPTLDLQYNSRGGVSSMINATLGIKSLGGFFGVASAMSLVPKIGKFMNEQIQDVYNMGSKAFSNPYEDKHQQQKSRYNFLAGLRHDSQATIARRAMLTDFGSPWRGLGMAAIKMGKMIMAPGNNHTLKKSFRIMKHNFKRAYRADKNRHRRRSIEPAKIRTNIKSTWNKLKRKKVPLVREAEKSHEGNHRFHYIKKEIHKMGNRTRDVMSGGKRDIKEVRKVTKKIKTMKRNKVKADIGSHFNLTPINDIGLMEGGMLAQNAPKYGQSASQLFSTVMSNGSVANKYKKGIKYGVAGAIALNTMAGSYTPGNKENKNHQLIQHRDTWQKEAFSKGLHRPEAFEFDRNKIGLKINNNMTPSAGKDRGSSAYHKYMMTDFGSPHKEHSATSASVTEDMMDDGGTTGGGIRAYTPQATTPFRSMPEPVEFPGVSNGLSKQDYISHANPYEDTGHHSRDTISESYINARSHITSENIGSNDDSIQPVIEHDKPNHSGVPMMINNRAQKYIPGNSILNTDIKINDSKPVDFSNDRVMSRTMEMSDYKNTRNGFATTVQNGMHSVTDHSVIHQKSVNRMAENAPTLSQMGYATAPTVKQRTSNNGISPLIVPSLTYAQGNSPRQSSARRTR